MRMKSLRSTLFFACCCAVSLVYAQRDNAVLMTVDGQPISAGEFEQVYLKNIDLVADDAQKDISGYLELFKNYKLKIAEAERLGYQNRPELKSELQGYEDQLADSYMTDAPVTDALVKEAYDHMVNEVRASHIMIALSPNASPEDTLKAWNRISAIRNKIIGGEDFEKLAKANSEDPSVRTNGGDLGWFNAFRMVYPFEKAAYNTPVGEVSPIIRTRYGYHILKTTDMRKSQGEVEVAHIMVALNAQDSVADPEARIRDIYKKLKQGESFEKLAQHYSDDAKTAKVGGRIGRFGFGALSSPTFEEHAFALQDTGEVSEPFKSEIGWHIIKLIQKYPVKPLSELRPSLESKIKSDSRSQIVETALSEKLSKLYHTYSDTTLIKQYFSKKKPGLNENKSVFIIKKDTLTLGDFERYVKSQPQQQQTNWKKSFSAFQGNALKNYYKSHLLESNSEYAQIIKEYREGILLFALMQDKVWNAAKEDSVGLKKYFEAHRAEYVQPINYDVEIATTTDPAFAKRVKKMLRANKSAAQIKEQLNKDGNVHVFFTKAQVAPGDRLLPKDYTGGEKLSKIYDSGKEQTIVILNGSTANATVSLDEVKGRVINDYQQFLEQEWLKKLKQKHTITVDQKVFNAIQKELSR